MPILVLPLTLTRWS